jgi:GNAT superfamily N-acetyltransferase
MEPTPYRIARLTDDCLPDVQRLLREVFGKRVSLAYLRRKYDTSHTGVQYMSSIAYDGERPIAFYGTVPQLMDAPQGEQLIACHAADLMTLEAYQRRGLHQQLAQAAYAWMRAADVAVVYGFLSESSYHSSKKLGWQEGGTMRGYAVSAASLPLAKVLRRLPVVRDWQVARTRRLLQRWAVSPAEFGNSQTGEGITVAYSPAFFASKSFHDNYWVALAGVKFWLSIDAIVRVGDVHFEQADDFARGLGELQRVCRRLGYGQILFQTFKGSRLDIALAAQHQGFESWQLGYLALRAGVDFAAYRPNYGDQDSF